jgi:hypothetical protein
MEVRLRLGTVVFWLQTQVSDAAFTRFLGSYHGQWWIHSVSTQRDKPSSTNFTRKLRQLLSYLGRGRRPFGHQERGRRLALRLAVELCSHKTKLASFNGVYATPSATDVFAQRQPITPMLSKFGEDSRSAMIPKRQRGSRNGTQQQS